MAGFGKTLMNVAAGALGGYGDYLTTRGKLQEEEKQQAAQSQRAMALEQFRANLQADRDTAEDERARGRIVLTGMVNRANNEAELGTKASLDAANDKRDFEIWKQKNAIEFKTWQQKSGIELSNAQKLELYKTEQGIRADAQKQGGKVIGDVIDENTGSRVYQVQQSDGTIRNYDTGIVVQQKSETNPLTGDVTRTTNKPTKKAAAGWRDGDGSGASSATGTGGGGRTNVDVTIDQLLTSYSSATPQQYPGLFRNGKKIPIEEAKAMVRRRYGG